MRSHVVIGRGRDGERSGWVVSQGLGPRCSLSVMLFLHRTLSSGRLLNSNSVLQVVLKVYLPRSTDRVVDLGYISFSSLLVCVIPFKYLDIWFGRPPSVLILRPQMCGLSCFQGPLPPSSLFSLGLRVGCRRHESPVLPLHPHLCKGPPASRPSLS